MKMLSFQFFRGGIFSFGDMRESAHDCQNLYLCIQCIRCKKRPTWLGWRFDVFRGALAVCRRYLRLDINKAGELKESFF